MAALTDNMQSQLNEQINAEMYSAYLYLAMAADFESRNFKGFANWMTVQASEEMTHAMKFYDFLNERGGRVTLGAIEQPPAQWETPLAAFEAALAHEKTVTARIEALVELAVEQKDRATEIMLQWFVTEQMEEEASADGIVTQLKMMAGAPGGLFLLDRELGRRVFTPPAEGGE